MPKRTIDEIVKQEVAKNKRSGNYKPANTVALVIGFLIGCVIFQLCWRGF